MTSETLRDHFAAAALTGLLATGQGPYHPLDYFARAAYDAADAMLRERAKTNHDAAPAARASEATASPERVRDRGDAGTGDTPKPINDCVSDRPKPIASEQEPVAWGVFRSDGEVAVIAFKRQDAEERATASDRIVSLYRQPTLTDAEREDMECAASRLESDANGPRDLQVAATLRGLLERLGGGR